MNELIIRADGNTAIGSGHIMRCLSIAQALQKNGVQCIFVCADEVMRDLIEQKGFFYYCLESDYRVMEKELPTLVHFIEEQHPAGILLDSYFATPAYMKILYSKTLLIYLDDQDTFLYPANIVINYNLFSSEMGYEKRYQHTETQVILGCRYVPLREEFCKLPLRPPTEKIQNILVSTGGADPMGIGQALLRYAEEKTNYEWHFIVGKLSSQMKKIQLSSEWEKSIHLHENVTQMAKLMCSCDLAISASGSTLYELCAAGTPTLCYTFADNQIPAAKAFDAAGLMISLGDYRDGTEIFFHKLDNAIKTVVRNPKMRTQLSNRMQTVVDGRGAERLAKQIIQSIALK